MKLYRMTGVLLLLATAMAVRMPAQEGDPQETLITSERLEMQGTAERNYFYFTGDVEVKGTNLQILCEELTVVAMREGPEEATIGKLEAIDGIVASGDVVIHQAGRSAYAGRAEVDPRAGTVTLSEEPRIIDGDVEVEGYQFVLHKGERKFESIPDPNAATREPSRSVVRLGAMPDLGFDQEEEAITVDERIGTPEEAGDTPEVEPSGDRAPDSGEGEEDAGDGN
ncbi:MAG: LptA/OstA family protein [Oceanipulchritudo sp.]